MEGLEPTRLAAPDPKSGTSTNFATSAELFLFSDPAIRASENTDYQSALYP